MGTKPVNCGGFCLGSDRREQSEREVEERRDRSSEEISASTDGRPRKNS